MLTTPGKLLVFLPISTSPTLIFPSLAGMQRQDFNLGFEFQRKQKTRGTAHPVDFPGVQGVACCLESHSLSPLSYFGLSRRVDCYRLLPSWLLQILFRGLEERHRMLLSAPTFPLFLVASCRPASLHHLAGSPFLQAPPLGSTQVLELSLCPLCLQFQGISCLLQLSRLSPGDARGSLVTTPRLPHLCSSLSMLHHLSLSSALIFCLDAGRSPGVVRRASEKGKRWWGLG